MNLFHVSFAIFLNVFLCFAADLALADQPIAGYVTKLRGDVQVVADARREPIALGHALRLGNRVITGTDARLEARMKDGTMLTLGELTEFVIAQVSGSTATSKSTRFELLKGVFRAITAPPDTGTASLQWQVRTPVAIIGVRGTELWGGFNLLNVGASTLDVVMLEGKGVYVENSAGLTELLKGTDGTTVAGAGAAPTALKPWTEKKLEAALKSVAW